MGNSRLESAKDAVRRLRWRLRAATGDASFHRAEVRARVERVGGVLGHGGWMVCPNHLDAESVVYSVGIGDDISFDLAMIRRFGVKVQAVDPTPASHAWLATQQLPPEFVLHPVGLAGYDGTASFAAADNPDWVSHSMVRTENRAVESFPVARLSTLMERLGHNHVDLLKVDIEGAEYDVIDDMLSSGVDVRQFLVEFHHRFDEVGWKKTDQAIADLRSAGFRLFYVNGRGEEYGFLRDT